MQAALTAGLQEELDQLECFKVRAHQKHSSEWDIKNGQKSRKEIKSSRRYTSVNLNFLLPQKMTGRRGSAGLLE